MRSTGSRVLLAATAVLILLSTLAGVVNRQVADGPAFVGHVDRIRQEPQVAQLIGDAITDRVIAADANLVALRPAVQALTTTLVRSSLFTPIFRQAFGQLHSAFTKRDSSPVVLQLADVGAVLAAALRTLDPMIARRLPADLDVTLAGVGSQTFAARTIHATRAVRLVSWLAAVLAALCAAGAVLLAPRRRAALAEAGLAVLGAGFVTAVVVTGISVWVAGSDPSTLRGALTAATWAQLSGSFWWAAAVPVLAGAVGYVAVRAPLAPIGLGGRVRRAAGWFCAPGPRPVAQMAAAAALVLVGAGVLWKPTVALKVGVRLVGMAVLLTGAVRISQVVSSIAPPPTSPTAAAGQRRRHRLAAAARVVPTCVAVVALVVFVAVQARPAVTRTNQRATIRLSDEPGTCNGFAALCDRPYNEVSYASTHNAMSVADAPGWFLPEQPHGLTDQLDAGVRALLIDTWSGQRTSRAGVITTSGADHARALGQSEQDVGPGVVASALRLRAAANLAPVGPAQPYLCHGLCELGATPLTPTMTGVKTWLEQHPRQVVTFVIEDSISPTETASVFARAGLLPYVHTQRQGQSWPTLGQLIDSGQRLVVFTERRGGGTTYPWLMQAFDWIQDTPYDNASAAALTCTRLRGTASHPLLLINNFLSRPQTRVSDSAVINAYPALLPYAERCATERGLIPNFVAVDYYDRGDVFDVVDQLNGVAAS